MSLYIYLLKKKKNQVINLIFIFKPIYALLMERIQKEDQYICLIFLFSDLLSRHQLVSVDLILSHQNHSHFSSKHHSNLYKF